MIYSGRPNPTFVLESRADIDRLRSALRDARALPRFERDTVVPSRLGYAGIRVENGSAEPGLPRSFVVYGGTIETHDGEKRFLADADRQLETVLVQQAARSGIRDDALAPIRADLRATSPETPPSPPARKSRKRRR